MGIERLLWMRLHDCVRPQLKRMSMWRKCVHISKKASQAAVLSMGSLESGILPSLMLAMGDVGSTIVLCGDEQEFLWGFLWKLFAQLAIAFTSIWEDHVGISVGHKEMVILDPLWMLQQLTEDPMQLLEDM